jgi:hypothetical protein
MCSAKQLAWGMLAFGVPVAAANTATYRLELNVPVTCTVDYTPTPGAANGEAALGKLSEYCNSPAGYDVRMLYPAGTLRGVTVRLNASAVVLDGSGETVIDSAPGAEIRRAELVATPGSAHVDPAVLSFAIATR